VDLIRYLLAQRSDLLTGIKVVVAVSSKEGHQGVYHLKIRAMSSETDLTSIFHQNVAKGYPGGGRAGAGSFTWDFSADQQTSEARLENELSQLMTAIHQLKQ
jgi:nanoRNase/pAp phosphatase (c-di-AMP/oligoRNAs hydrolase)